jgi:predicted DNA-binding transcriptional regulator YafY
MKTKTSKVEWSISRLIALFAGFKKPMTLENLEKRYGVHLSDLMFLKKHLLGQSEETGITGDFSFSLEMERLPNGQTLVRPFSPAVLERSLGVSISEAKLSLEALTYIEIPEPRRKVIKEIEKGLRDALSKGKKPTEHHFLFSRQSPPFLDTEGLKLAQAVQEEIQLEFIYEGSDKPQRKVHPLSLRNDDGVWRLLAWDLDRQGLRIFKLTHIQNVVLGKMFKWPIGFDKSKIRSVDLSIYQPNGKEQTVLVQIRNPALERYQSFFPNVRINKKDMGWKRLSMVSQDPNWAARLFLPAIGDVQILSPAEFKKAWLDEIKVVIGLYS